MKRETIYLSVLFALLTAAAVGPHVWADGVVLPDHPDRGWLSIVYHDVNVTVRDGVVTTHVDQLFRNETGRDLEGQYVFPLPPGAVVSSFTMWVDGVALEAQILNAEEARAIYEDFVRRAIDPALLEYVGRGAVSARIFPVPMAANAGSKSHTASSSPPRAVSTDIDTRSTPNASLPGHSTAYESASTLRQAVRLPPSTHRPIG